MRELADAWRIRRFMRSLGRVAAAEGTCFLAGGATAVLEGWRPTTLDVDIALDPDQDEILRALPALKEELRVNVELASPADFIPLPPGWRERSAFVAREGRLTFRNFDPYSQTLAKLERGHRQDLEDARSFLSTGGVKPDLLLSLFAEIEPELYRFPAIDPRAFRSAVEDAVAAG